jgi:hypothetical protein
MALKRQYNSQEEIPEELQPLYTEKEGKWLLDAEPGEGEKHAEDVRRALRARDQEKAEREALRQQLEELRAKIGDIDLEKIPDLKEAQKRAEEAEHQRLIDEKKFEEAAESKFHRKIAEMVREIESLKKAIPEKETMIESLYQELSNTAIDQALQHVYHESGGDPRRTRYAIQALRDGWEFDRDGRKPIPIQRLEDGTVITATGSDGNPLTMKEHVATFLRDEPWFQLQSNGSDSTHQGRTGNGAARFQITGDQIKSDFRSYERLKEAAAKAGAQVEIVG